MKNSTLICCSIIFYSYDYIASAENAQENKETQQAGQWHQDEDNYQQMFFW